MKKEQIKQILADAESVFDKNPQRAVLLAFVELNKKAS